MSGMNLNQIIDRLNAEFTGDTRKLVFWYDDKAEFAEDIGSVELANAKVYRLEPDNQFYTKYFLERMDPETCYLSYTPFQNPDVMNYRHNLQTTPDGKFYEVLAQSKNIMAKEK